jgi:DNA-binding transcriptional LysR family regulator
MMDKFQEMKVFSVVVEGGSFTLLRRTTRKLSPTTEGEIFHTRCRELLENLDEAEAGITSGTLHRDRV